MSTVTTIERFILDQQPQYARGELTMLLYDIALAAKIIAHKTNRAGLIDIVGEVGATNVQGESQQKLDIFAHDIIRQLCDHTGRLCLMVSEEQEDPLYIPDKYSKGSYVLVFDPLDGSSNIDVNVSIGTIFGVYHCIDDRQRGRLEDALQPGRDLVAAGYILYGASTMLIYSTGDGVHGFTLNPEYGEFLLSHPNLVLPEPPAYYSVNSAYYNRWSPGVQRFVEWLQGVGEEPPGLSARYIGSLVADFHRNLLRGGIFFYPAESVRDEGKLRLLYEAAPLAFLIEQANGYASNGRQSILDIVPRELHQRTALFIGNRWLVEQVERFIRQEEDPAQLMNPNQD
ncbi:MAG: class 1 fructose-bisphosphatase [Anaerolineae bacterium]|uniref:class 1 fructose-bisphosphatase n=1 Tax=Promineifilum sp. TaxID=2664178 RepID=UPI001D44F77A|nr:class 1 fructose-bisphosphatase [Anaerolineales bacterium]MCB8935631.1 class 1 fructose-bisphosphatase [Promineifilum sp.]MCO5180765.1 class 1 fructose-bisphosphatase [Promineifilum sp.]MCW5845964.1 class 1 fructose-bisphosphatase [Anaerolineae bacterium]